MKIYLDTCSLQRPMDNRQQLRIALEAEAIMTLLSLFEAGKVALVSSEALLYEVSRNPHSQRKDFVYQILARMDVKILVTDEVERRAVELQSRGFAALDALHLASAESADVDLFCTCDDKFLNRIRVLTDCKIKAVSPLELIQEILR